MSGYIWKVITLQWDVAGNPQSLILNSLLSAVYISQLANAVKHPDIHMYTDDTYLNNSINAVYVRHAILFEEYNINLIFV